MMQIVCAIGSKSVASRLSFHLPQREQFLTRSIALSIDVAYRAPLLPSQELETPCNKVRPPRQKLSRRTRSRRRRHRVDLNESSTKSNPGLEKIDDQRLVWLINADFSITHLTDYRYPRFVAFGEHRMTLRPRDDEDQRVIQADLTISPRPEESYLGP
jgi:hypothetical protein